MRQPALRQGDLAYLDPLRAAQVVEDARAATWAIYLLLAMVACAVGWAWVAQVDIIAKADARVVPDGKEQVIASLEGGILRELHVREGQRVNAGDTLALLDPTRFESQQAEGKTKAISLMGAVARLAAEATGQPPRFPDEVKAMRAVIDGETESYQARQTALREAVAMQRRSIDLLRGELNVAEGMALKGLMSEVEVMRLRRQLNELTLQVQERVNRFRQEASAELVKVRTELSMLQEQMVNRDDQLRRTVLKSPVVGVVKSIKNHTLGGVVSPGAPLMEILPIGSQVLVEARVRPSDIGFVKVGQDVKIKLSAYEYTVYGGLAGQVLSISPDAINDTDRSGDGSYYRALVRASTSLESAGKPLSVMPGMTGSAEIRTGQRSVLGFVLRPMLKSQEAFRER
ncbi:MAG: HlyD family type I secretion periplasmic adaptor subunit [Rubrivivax sp.]|jgi:adhesin transport system membrane fusion protein|nr:HlyD family type I secretion periplasmic adaptor subunit [Rubrivivax sp.]